MSTKALIAAPSAQRVFCAAGLSLLVSVGGCGQVTPRSAEGPAVEEGRSPAPGARVFLVEPPDGANVAGPVFVVFGVENVELGAVPIDVRSSSPRLSVDHRLVEIVTPREGIVHHHLGIDTDCLPPGAIVPAADPWIHFDDGASQVELLLPAGEHVLVLQAGDDEHRTIEGLCHAITIAVTEG